MSHFSLHRGESRRPDSREVELGVGYDSLGNTEDTGKRIFKCLNFWMEAGKYIPTQKTLLSFSLGGSLEWFLRTVNEYKNLKGLKLSIDWAGSPLSRPDFSHLCERIHSNELVESLMVYSNSRKTLDGKPSTTRTPDQEGWTHLFQCLRHKRRLKKLEFEHVLEGDECFRGLMNLLQENIYLEEVELPSAWRFQGKDALVKEALRRNKAQATYFSILHSAGLPFGEARAGRIFLCGEPFAGKTQLRASMIGTTGKKSRGMKQLLKLGKLVGLERTKGIDVELLRDDEKMQITIWDFGGQEIFWALQSLLLPAITQPCVFVVVFSPMKDDQRHLKDDPEEAFRNELESWLRFISSSYPITGTFLPEVLVVISHRDLMKKRKLEGSCHWASKIMKDLRKEYQRALKLHEDFYYIDAHDEKEVQPFVEENFRLFSSMLQTTTPQAPVVCSGLIPEILNLQKEKDHQPVWQFEKFYRFLSNRLKPQAAGCFDPTIGSEREILKAMSLYLHDVGSIFLLADSELVVIDINWLTHKFLGRLIREGHDFQPKTQILQESSSQDPGQDGFVSEFYLEKALRSVSSKKSKLDLSTMIQVLVSLDLCYKVEGTGGKFFTPTIVGRQRVFHKSLSWLTVDSPDWQHVGYRLLCENRNTASLTSFVFPRFQIHFRKVLMERWRGVINDKTYICQRDVIRFDWNGYFVIIENDGVAGEHVDILVRFSKSKPRQAALSFVKEQILEKFRLFCASLEGCRGVTLATAIIRTDCVRTLTPQKYREDQVIREGLLKENLRDAVLEKSRQAEVAWSTADESVESLLDYEHIWPPVLCTCLLKCSQRAVELLEEKDVQEILEPLYQSKTVRLESLTDAWEQVDGYLSKGRRGDASDVDIGGSRRNDEPFILADRDRRLVEVIQREVKGIHQHLDEVHESLSKQLFIFDKKIHSLLLASATKIDEMMGDTAAMADAKFPRRPFITVSDVGVGEKIKGFLQVGTPVQLHFLCESYLGPHVVDDQAGLKLVIGDKDKEWLRRIVGVSLKVFWFLLKAGLQVGLAAGNALPEIDSSLGLKSGLVVGQVTVEKLQELKSLPVIEGTEMTEEVWRILRGQLSNIYIPETFKLQQVKYYPGRVKVEESCAWLCDTCIANGKKNNVLKLV
ncbi:hypothetical protein R1sor_006156 [Riccia sorocarpa]|uniref:C-terminal of Roc (COR) domain-containing protein n=1 Tax=Riccia sorocarpa TaxID=122646 RepID=A0ABD3HLK6_9MARC